MSGSLNSQQQRQDDGRVHQAGQQQPALSQPQPGK